MSHTCACIHLSNTHNKSVRKYFDYFTLHVRTRELVRLRNLPLPAINKWQDRFKTRRRQWHPTPVLLPGKSHGQRSLVGCSPWGHEESDTTERLHFHFSLSCIGEGNGNPLQCSCLENLRDGGAWWAAIYGVTQSWTRLKWLSCSSSLKTQVYLVSKLSSFIYLYIFKSHSCENYELFIFNSYIYFSSVQFSHSVISDFLRSHESQHTRPPCPSPTPRVH